jgi:hypothetical protein
VGSVCREQNRWIRPLTWTMSVVNAERRALFMEKPCVIPVILALIITNKRNKKKCIFIASSPSVMLINLA